VLIISNHFSSFPRQVKGCPLKVLVSAVCDATQVLCSGSGLSVGTLGQDIRSFIDTRRAGPGELSAHCVGPNKVAYCELYDHSDGTFTLNVKPQESGRHVLTVKYGGECYHKFICIYLIGLRPLAKLAMLNL
jgi:Filamin/ABP280 repeat.